MPSARAKDESRVALSIVNEKAETEGAKASDENEDANDNGDSQDGVEASSSLSVDVVEEELAKMNTNNVEDDAIKVSVMTRENVKFF